MEKSHIGDTDTAVDAQTLQSGLTDDDEAAVYTTQTLQRDHMIEMPLRVLLI